MFGGFATRTCQPNDCKGQAWQANQPAAFTLQSKRVLFLRPKACPGSAREISPLSGQ